MDALENRLGNAGRRGEPVPIVREHRGQADLGRGRHIGQQGRAGLAGDRQGLDVACLDVRQQHADIEDDQLDLAGHGHHGEQVQPGLDVAGRSASLGELRPANPGGFLLRHPRQPERRDLPEGSEHIRLGKAHPDSNQRRADD